MKRRVVQTAVLRSLLIALMALVFRWLHLPSPSLGAGFHPGGRVLLDAHNCYPSNGKGQARMDRALRSGLPLAIEQDLVWYTDPRTGRSWSIISHGEPLTGHEPTLRDHFFERIRPIVEDALRAQHQDKWPLIVLNLDFKTNEPEHHKAIWSLLGEYESWLSTAKKGATGEADPLQVRPVLVLTGDSPTQQSVFHDQLKVGERLRVFGAVRWRSDRLESSPEEIVNEKVTNYRRWWNNPWRVVEREGQRNAGEWTATDQRRLEALVNHAHRLGLWIRFYTLNGHPAAETPGWMPSYNFGSLQKVQLRWRACIEAGVDFIATDQYESLSQILVTSQAYRGVASHVQEPARNPR
ncbi:MAG: hypothetical protein AB1898_20290 [Acidobacteriota bacterium]